MFKEYSRQEAAAHKSREDIYVVLKNKVYDVTQFINMHPGGEEAIIQFAGQDVTEAFDEVGHSGDAHKQLEEMLIGILDKQSLIPQFIASSESPITGKGLANGRHPNWTSPFLLVAAISGAIIYGLWHAAKH